MEINMIHNEARYEAAIARNIRLNANKTRSANWMAMTGSERVYDFLFERGEFEPSYRDDGQRAGSHPVVKASYGKFFSTLRDNVNEWGGLTEKQNDAALAMIARGEERVAGYAAKRSEEAATSNWIGTVGERRNFAVTIRNVIVIDGVYGYSYLHIMHDADGNSVIYKGTNVLGEKGTTVTVKATINEHGEREGVKQTKISRPK
jgi:hypothetical protein